MKEKKKAVKRHLAKPVVFLTIILEIIVSLFICVTLIFYTPFFKTIEKYIVSSAMESRTQQYLAHLFLSDKQIKELTQSVVSKTTTPQKIASIKSPNSGDTTIKEYEVSGSQFTGYVLEINDPLRVKVGMTQYVGKVGELTSAIAERMGAIAAVNGGGFQGGAKWSDSAQNPTNFVIHNGNVIWKDKEWDNDSKVNVIALNNRGVLVVGNHSINELEKLNVREAVTMPNDKSSDFRPFIINGEGQFEKGGSESRAPRTAIAQRKDGTLLMVALDGRQVGQLGATYYEMQQLILDKFSTQDNPVETATILDGGGSTTMYYDGQLINHPSAAFGERTVATAFYVEQ